MKLDFVVYGNSWSSRWYDWTNSLKSTDHINNSNYKKKKKCLELE